MSNSSGINIPYSDSPASKNTYTFTLWFIIALGIAFRLFHFFNNRSLWEDEIYLSAGTINMNFHELLTQPLPYLQKAPIGYLLITRFLVNIFGNNEMALRLYPLLTGIVALLLFVPVSRYFLKPFGVIVALAIMALAPPIIYHTVEAKPYGTELFATVLMLWLYIRYQYETKLGTLFMWGLYGAVLMWFVYTSIFVQAGVAIAVATGYLKKKDWKVLFRLAVPFGMWVLSFGISYLMYAKQGSNSGWLVDFWNKHDGYIPLAPVSAVTWIIHRIFSFFHYPLGFSWVNDWAEHNVVKQIIQRMAVVPVIFLLAGILWLYQYRKRYLLLTVVVLFIALITSALKLYPFHERLTVYLAPIMIIVMAAGGQLIADKWIWVAWFMGGLLLFGPLKNSVQQVANPNLFGDYKKSYQREALQHLNHVFNTGDAVYIYWNELPAYKLYQNMLPLKFKAINGQDYRHQANNFEVYFSKIDADLKAIRKKRIWIVYSNIDIPVGDYIGDPAWYYQKNDGIPRFYEHLKTIGKVTDTYQPKGKGAVSNVHIVLLELP